MRRRLLPATWLLFLISLAIDVCGWGGLAFVPKLGAVVERHAPQESFLAASYLYAGKPLATASGLVDPARRFAESRFERGLPAAATDPALAMDRLLGGMDTTMRLSHYGAPLLLALAIVLQLLRPKQVRVIGRRG